MHTKGRKRVASEEVKLLGTWTSPFSRRVEIALNHKGIPYQYIEIDLNNKIPLLLQSNPIHKQVPVLLHNGKAIVESQVILEYIDETWKSNPILPQGPNDRAMVRFWCRFIDDKVKCPDRKATTVNKRDGEAAQKEAYEALKTLEKELKGKMFFGGERFGMVDIAAIRVALTLWVPACEEAAGGNKVFTRESFPELSNWADGLLSCGVFRENLPCKEDLVVVFKARFEAAAKVVNTE